MSRLSDLLQQLAQKDAQLAGDLRAEVQALESRRAFGLNFERHVPENVELPGRPIRRGDKVRFLPPRSNAAGSVDKALWRVKSIRSVGGERVAELIPLRAEAGAEPVTRKADDLIVVAEFRDPIYPGLVSTGRIERGGDKPFHTVINAENFHALQALTYTHAGKVDAIYIDPPYNTGAKDWKYNNDYVDGEDAYRHSKWLAFMERRLKLARRLLNPANSVLICTIDEKEYLRLGLLLEQTFPEARIQMVSSVISQKGSARAGEFSRCNEFLYFVGIGCAHPIPQETDMLHDRRTTAGDDVEWGRLTRNGATGRRTARPNLFYPIFFSHRGVFHSIGNPLRAEEDRGLVTPPSGTVTVFPISGNGTEMTWALSGDKFLDYVDEGFIKFGRFRAAAPQQVRIYYLTSGYVKAAREGAITRMPGQPVRWVHSASKGMKPMTVWNMPSHNAAEGGTNLLKSLLSEPRFPFPKSLYAVEDALRFFVADKPNAIVLDFFSGSGTTAHAVMRLNKQDGGRRQCISVTNNEVASDEQKTLRERGLRPGDPEWERWGICDYITKPRIQTAITGKTPEGEPIAGDYKFTDEFPMADGFAENAEFFTMTYEAPRPVAHHQAFAAVAPLLWLKAGAQGRRIDVASNDFALADSYAVLFDLDAAKPFFAALAGAPTIAMAFIVTDDDRGFQAVCVELPERIEPVRLYESYLTNFTLNVGMD